MVNQISNPQYHIVLRHPTTYERMVELTDYASMEYGQTWGRLDKFTLAVWNSHPQIKRIRQTNIIVEVVRDNHVDFTGWVVNNRTNLTSSRKNDSLCVLSGWNAPPDFVDRVTLPAPSITTDASATAGADWDTFTGPADSAMRYFVNANLITTPEPARVIPNLLLGTGFRPTRFTYQPVQTQLLNQQSVTVGLVIPYTGPFTDFSVKEELEIGATEEFTTYTYKARFHDLLQVLNEICDKTETSWQIRLEPDDGLLYFDVLLGADRTEENTSGYDPMAFSVERKNADDIEYEVEGSNVKNVVYTAMNGELTTRVITIDNKTGIKVGDWITPDPMGDPYIIPESMRRDGRREGFLDLRAYPGSAEAESQIESYFQEHSPQIRLKWRAIDSTIQSYPLAWQCGDLVSVSCDEIDIPPTNARITEVRTSLAPGRLPEMSINVGARPKPLGAIQREFTMLGFYARVI